MKRAGLMAALAALLTVAAVAVAAQGDKPKLVVAVGPPVDQGGGEQDFSGCSGGKHLVGGGLVPEGSPSGLYVVANGALNSPILADVNTGDEPTEFFGRWENLGGGDDRIYRVMRVCMNERHGATLKVKEFAANDDGWGKATASCPRNKVAVSGGVIHDSTNQTYVQTTGPLARARNGYRATSTGDTPRAWYGSLYDAGAGEDETYKLTVICARIPGAEIRVKEATVDRNKVKQKRIKCPDGSFALGGGVVQKGSPVEVYMNASGPLGPAGTAEDTESGDRPQSWLTSFLRDGGSTTNKFKLMAVCA